MKSTRIAGMGHYVPDRIVSNGEIEKRLDLPEGWIERRTGIRQRRYAAPGQAVTDLARQAAGTAMKDAGVAPGDVGILLLATSTPDHLLPPSAPLLAHQLGCMHAGAMDIAGACTGFVQAFALADSFVRTHGCKALVVGANVLSRRINPEDAVSSVLFGDGAGAVLLAPTEDSATGLLGHVLSSSGADYDLIKIAVGGSREPFAPSSRLADTRIAITSNRIAYARAIESMVATSRAAIADAAIGIAEVDWWLPHQANLRLIEAARRQLAMPRYKVLLSAGEYANSSAATIPLTLSMHRERLAPGQVILMTAVGAGFTEGALVYRI